MSAGLTLSWERNARQRRGRMDGCECASPYPVETSGAASSSIEVKINAITEPSVGSVNELINCRYPPDRRRFVKISPLKIFLQNSLLNVSCP